MRELDGLVLDITAEHPEGLSHAELVRAILDADFDYDGENLSADVLESVQRLSTFGWVEKNVETRTVTPKREFACA